ncbi:MAG: WD40 repeat domain-containing protein, partial [Anaerolineales bacterium]|nr:WD40 repeat domain-containing protein [Anaerolineales bacterium]
RAGAVPSSPDWFMVDMLPSTHPLEELETALLRVAVNPPASLLEQMQHGERGILQAVRRILPEGGELLLLIDQFEELFTLTDEQRRGEFLAGLLTAVSDPRSPLRLLITLRADFYDRPLQHEQLGRLLQQQTELVLPLSAAEIEQAIVQPAQAVGCHFEPGLVSTIVADIQDQPGSLPLLQYALTELFERRDGNRLTKATYAEIGGVLGALGRRAEEIYAQLHEPDQQLARQLFLRLVTLGEGVEDTRRRVLQSELLALAGEQGSGGAGEQSLSLSVSQSPSLHLLDLYGRFRLLTFDHDPASREPTVEVAHEALLREWPRLRDWLAESRHDVGMQRLLAHGAQEWEQAQQDASYLLRGSRLVQFEDWVSDSSVVLTPGERAFLQASVAAREARQAEEEARRQRELQTAQQLAETERQRAEEQVAAAGRLRQRAIYLGVAALLAVLLAVAAFGFSRQSNQNANLAAAREQEAVAEADQRATAEANAVAAAVEAQAAQATAQAEAMTRAQAEQEASSQRDLAQASAQEAVQAYSLSLAANARQALEANDQQLALLLALAANKVPDPPLQSWQTLLDIAYAPGLKKELPTTTTGVVAVSPDGQTIAVGSPGGVVSLFDAVSGERLQQLEESIGVNSMAFHADGQLLLLGLSNGEVVLWDLAAGALVRRFAGHVEAVSYVGFHPNGRYIISTEDGRAPADIIVWDMATGEMVRRFGSEEGGNFEGIRNMAITPDGTKALAGVGSQNRTNPYPLVLWNLETGEPIRFFEGLARSVNGVDVSPNGRLGLSGSADGSVRLWDLETGEMLKRLDGHEGIVIRVAFSPDGRTALSTSLDHTIIWWNLDSGEIIHRFAGYYANDAWG